MRLNKMENNMQLIKISFAGPERFIIDRRNNKWRFEDHPHCGPIVIDRFFKPEKTQPPEKSPFWEAVNLWYGQGKRLFY